jgi:hypothetical protein
MAWIVNIGQQVSASVSTSVLSQRKETKISSTWMIALEESTGKRQSRLLYPLMTCLGFNPGSRFKTEALPPSFIQSVISGRIWSLNANYFQFIEMGNDSGPQIGRLVCSCM